MTFLDWASTSPVIRFTASKYDGSYYNPNAAYAYAEREVLMDCEERIKAAIGVKGGHVLYFRCATEAIRWLWTISFRHDPSVWWRQSPYEHDACVVEQSCASNSVGRHVDFYIHQWVNHITGEIFNFEKIKGQLPERTHLVVDATAGFGKAMLPQDIDNIADALFMSGHKIGCPELSFMWLNDELCEWLGAAKDIRNQWGLHHGSLSAASVLALADAVEWACDEEALIERENKWFDLAIKLDAELDKVNVKRNFIPTVSASEAGKPFALAINAIRLNGINADALQQFLATRGIYIGVGGSACSAAHDYRVLRTYGLTDNEASEVIRVSFGPETITDDIKQLVNNIKEYKERFVV